MLRMARLKVRQERQGRVDVRVHESEASRVSATVQRAIEESKKSTEVASDAQDQSGVYFNPITHCGILP
jgi:hypothetical protein